MLGKATKTKTTTTMSSDIFAPDIDEESYRDRVIHVKLRLTYWLDSIDNPRAIEATQQDLVQLIARHQSFPLMDGAKPSVQEVVIVEGHQD